MRPRNDIRIVDLYSGRILFELRQVEKDHAIRAVRALLRPRLPSRADKNVWEGVAPAGWAVQPAAKVKRDGRWVWVGPKTAQQFGVFPKQEAV